MPPKKSPVLVAKRFYVVVPADATSEKVIDSLESAQNAALAFVNQSATVGDASLETTHINGVVCCTVWYRPAAPAPKPKPAPKAKAKASKPQPLKPQPLKPLAAGDDSSAASASYQFAAEAGDVELKTVAAPAAASSASSASSAPKKKKLGLAVPAKYAGSALRVGMKMLNVSAGENGDSASLQLICHLGDATTEHSFTAKKSTLAALGYADMEEGTVNLKELVLLSMHFIVDDAATKLADIPPTLTPERLHELFPTYTKTVAKPGSQAASADGACAVQ